MNIFPSKGVVFGNQSYWNTYKGGERLGSTPASQRTMKTLEWIGEHLPSTPVLCAIIALLGVALVRPVAIRAEASPTPVMPAEEFQVDDIPLELRQHAESDIPTSATPVIDESVEQAVQDDGYDIPTAATSFKAWMSYRAITSKRSDQWKLQQKAWTDSDGFRRYGDEGYYMVALGTYYAERCGKVFDITFESGTTIRCIVGDIKANVHTDELNQHRNGNVVEFIVDGRAISNTCKRMGDMSYAASIDLTGKPTRIAEADCPQMTV